ncbi:flavin reductase family protein [Streptomyces poonensis]|uniref:Ferredoxin reductase n=1 Tax=Streptomyces poonensis TaxID=68255 RepID=A0A918UXK6_9ACTN|nr:iron-sulfur cluster-binding domain-containing protein [Streptomyces poonensis]GGZ41761.1 ferredoxin reductase [Streptomyces poonensis]
MTLVLRPNANWRGFEAGQYVRLGVEVNGVRRHRCFSLASSAHRKDRSIEISARVNPDGIVSPYLKHRATTGEMYTVSPAQGEFTLPERRPAHLLMIGSGSGVTPLMSILRTLHDEHHSGRVTFLHYARTEADMLYRDELEDMTRHRPHLTVVRAYTAQRTGGDLYGHLSEEHLAAVGVDVVDVAAADAYVSGPPDLVETVRGIWTARGLADRLHTENFAAPVAPTAAPTTHSVPHAKVIFARSGVSAPAAGVSLLELAEASGLRPPFGCRQGICTTCTSRKLGGTVRHLLNGEVSHVEEEQIRLCVSAPYGDVTLDL